MIIFFTTEIKFLFVDKFQKYKIIYGLPKSTSLIPQQFFESCQ